MLGHWRPLYPRLREGRQDGRDLRRRLLRRRPVGRADRRHRRGWSPSSRSGTRRSPRSSPESRCPSQPSSSAIPSPSCCSESRRSRRFCSCTVETCAACAPGPSVASASAGRAMRRLALGVGLLAGLWLAPGALASGWCGSGETAADRQDVLTGRQVHAIVALPADAPDTFADDANIVADDVAVDLVVVGQARTRRACRTSTRRTSTARAVSTSRSRDCPIRLRATPARARVSTGRRSRRSCSTRASRIRTSSTSSTTTGATADANICGTGGGQLDVGPSFAVVYRPAVRACRPTPSRPTSCSTRSAPSHPAIRIARATRVIPATRRRTSSTPTRAVSRSRRRCSTTTTTTTTGTRELAGRAGLALAASARRAAGRVDRVVVGPRHRDERRPGRRLLGNLQHAMGSGNGGVARRGACRDRPLRPLDGSVHRRRDLSS